VITRGIVAIKAVISDAGKPRSATPPLPRSVRQGYFADVTRGPDRARADRPWLSQLPQAGPCPARPRTAPVPPLPASGVAECPADQPEAAGTLTLHTDLRVPGAARTRTNCATRRVYRSA